MNPISIKNAAAILGVTTRQIKDLMATTTFCGEGDHGNLVSLAGLLTAFRARGELMACPCCGDVPVAAEPEALPTAETIPEGARVSADGEVVQ